MKKIILTLTALMFVFGAILTPNAAASAAFFEPD